MSQRNRAKRKHPRSAPRRGRQPATRRPQRHWGAWAGILAVVAVVGAMLWFGRSQGGSGTVKGTAPNFTLTSTDGRQVSLADYRGKDVLLYFNEGVGCDACFYQMTEIEKHATLFQRDGVTVLPIAVNPAPDVQTELTRFGLHTPWLIDSGMNVSNQYGVIGIGMHANMPGHSFVFVGPDGRIRWHGDFPSMFVSAPDLLHAMGLQA